MNSTNQKAQNGLQINLNHTEPIKCGCGNETFEQITFLRKLPGILSPTLKDEFIPIPAFRCTKCKNLFEFEPVEKKKKGFFSQ